MLARSLPCLLFVVAALLGCATAQSGGDAEGKCRTYLVLPPRHDDEEASDYVARAWIAAATPELKKCNRIIPYGTGKAALLPFDITHEKKTTRDDLGDEQADKLIERTGATHVVAVRFHVVHGALVMKPIAYRLRPWERAAGRPETREVTQALPEDSPLKLSKAAHFALKGLRLVPNAVTVGFTSSELSNDRVDKHELVQTGSHENSFVPPVLSSISLGNVDHPDSLGLWDYRFGWFGSIEFADFDTTYQLALPGDPSVTPPAPETPLPPYTLKLFAAVPTINGEFLLHTPLGSTFLALGWGPGFYTYHDSLHNSGTGVISVVRVEFGHLIFFSERWFLEISVNLLEPNPSPVKNEDFVLSYRNYSMFGIGYYFPELRSLTRRAL